MAIKRILYQLIQGAVVVFVGVYFKAPIWAIVFAFLGTMWLQYEVSKMELLHSEVARILCELIGHIPGELKKYEETAPCLRCGVSYTCRPLGGKRISINPEYEETIASRLQRLEAKLGIEDGGDLKYLNQ